MRVTLWSFLIVSALAPLAAGHDLLPPSWRGEPGTSTLVYDNYWDTYDSFTSYDGTLAEPEIGYECTAWSYWDAPPAFGGPGYGWKLPWNYKNCRLFFNMDNYDNDNLYKDIRIQVTFYAPNYYEYFGDPWYLNVWACSNEPFDPEHPENWSCDGNVGLEPKEATIVPTYNGWMCAAFDLQLRPNPDSETIAIQFGDYWPWWYYPTGDWAGPYPYGGHIYIDQVVIDTRCSDVPEPSVFCLLAIGGAVVLFVRRR